MYVTSRRPGSLAQMTQRQLAFCFCSSNYSHFKNNTQGIDKHCEEMHFK